MSSLQISRRVLPGIALGIVVLVAYQGLPAGVPAPVIRANLRKSAPGFTLKDPKGIPVRLSDYRGKAVLLNFWETSCAPCRIEIPWFIQFEQSYRDRGFAVLGVALDEEGWRSVKPYMDAKRINYRMLLGNDQVARLYGGLDAIPTTLIIDKAGRVAATHVGLAAKKDYEAEIKTVLSEQ